MNKLNKLAKLLPNYFKALFNKETPTTAKILAVAAIIYIVMPADLVPDLLPFLGYIDDTVITAGLIYFSNKLIPDDIIKEEDKKSIENKE